MENAKALDQRSREQEVAQGLREATETAETTETAEAIEESTSSYIGALQNHRCRLRGLTDLWGGVWPKAAGGDRADRRAAASQVSVVY